MSSLHIIGLPSRTLDPRFLPQNSISWSKTFISPNPGTDSKKTRGEGDRVEAKGVGDERGIGGFKFASPSDTKSIVQRERRMFIWPSSLSSHETRYQAKLVTHPESTTPTKHLPSTENLKLDVLLLSPSLSWYGSLRYAWTRSQRLRKRAPREPTICDEHGAHQTICNISLAWLLGCYP